MMNEIRNAEEGGNISELIPVAQEVAKGMTFVSRDPDFRGEVKVDSVSSDRVHYSGDADGNATIEEFIKGYAPLSIENMTMDQLNGRVHLLASEMDANDEENRAYQSEIDKIYARIDAMKS